MQEKEGKLGEAGSARELEETEEDVDDEVEVIDQPSQDLWLRTRVVDRMPLLL